MNVLRSLCHRTRYPSKLINNINKVQIRNINKVKQEPDDSSFHQKKISGNRGKGGQHDRGYKMKEMSNVAWKLYEEHMLKKQDFSGVLALLEAVRCDTNSADKLDFKKGYDIIEKGQMNSATNHKVKLKTVNRFKLNCERMNNQELLALLFHIILNNKGKPIEMWPSNMKFLFVLLDLEIRRRIYVTFQLENYETKDTLEFIEIALQVMLANKVGQQSFQAYIDYCMHRFDSAINMENISLLLLCIVKLYSSPGELFLLIENFTLQNFHHFDLKTLSLLCLSFFVGNTQISSVQLLDQIGTKLLHQLKLKGARLVDKYDLTEILKALRHSGYTKASFYYELELSLIADDFIETCNVIELMHILDSYGTFKIFPSVLIERIVAQCKNIIEMPKNQNLARPKDIGRLILTLGMFQYGDSTEPSIYSLCARYLLKEMTSSRYTSKQIAMALTDCLIGMAYVGKFQDAILDALFGLPDVGDLLQDLREEDLLLLHHSVQLEYPEYTGRKINQNVIDQLQQEMDEKWSTDEELEKRGLLQDSISILTSLLGEESLETRHILPHIKTADIELYLNEKNELVQPHLAEKRAAIEIIGQLQCRKGTDILLGKYALKLRHLKLLGYKTILVYPSDQDLMKECDSLDEKMGFWIRKLQDSGVKIDTDTRK